MHQGEHIMTVTSMEYPCRETGRPRVGQVIQIGTLRRSIDSETLKTLTNLPTGVQATYRDPEMAAAHGDLGLELRAEDIPLVIPHFGDDPLRGFGELVTLRDPETKPWAEHFPLFFRELVSGTKEIKQWFEERGSTYRVIYEQLLGILGTA